MRGCFLLIAIMVGCLAFMLAFFTVSHRVVSQNNRFVPSTVSHTAVAVPRSVEVTSNGPIPAEVLAQMMENVPQPPDAQAEIISPQAFHEFDNASETMALANADVQRQTEKAHRMAMDQQRAVERQMAMERAMVRSHQTRISWIMLMVGGLFLAFLFIIILTLARAGRRRSRSEYARYEASEYATSAKRGNKSGGEDDDVAELVRGMKRMGERLEALETIIINRSQRG